MRKHFRAITCPEEMGWRVLRFDHRLDGWDRVIVYFVGCHLILAVKLTLQVLSGAVGLSVPAKTRRTFVATRS